ncbi:MAG: PilZ domain-containing protein, partial [Pseudomonadota bacterium]
FIEVNLEASVLVSSNTERSLPGEILALSPNGAILRSDTNSAIGESLQLTLKSEQPINLRGNVKNYLKWNDTKKVFLVKFENLNQPQTDTLQQIMGYFTRLKKAGVQLGT